MTPEGGIYSQILLSHLLSEKRNPLCSGWIPHSFVFMQNTAAKTKPQSCDGKHDWWFSVPAMKFAGCTSVKIPTAPPPPRVIIVRFTLMCLYMCMLMEDYFKSLFQPRIIQSSLKVSSSCVSTRYNKSEYLTETALTGLEPMFCFCASFTIRSQTNTLIKITYIYLNI